MGRPYPTASHLATHPSLEKGQNSLRAAGALPAGLLGPSGRRQRGAEARRPCPLLTFPPARRPLPTRQRPRRRGGAILGRRAEKVRPPGAAPRAAESKGARQRGGHGAGEPGWAGRCRADRGVRALTVLLGAGGGAEQQQERSPTERLHGWGRRRGAEGAGEKSSEARAEETERRFRGGDPMAMSRPTGSAGGGGDCAAPSRLRLHLRRAGGGGGGGGSSSRASRALLNRRPPYLHLPAPGRN